MNEVFTKRFWQGVRKTFDEALKGQPPEDNASQPSAEGIPKASSSSETPSLPSATREQN